MRSRSRSRSSPRTRPSPLPSSTDTVLAAVVRHRQVGPPVAVQVPDRHGARDCSRSRSRSSPRSGPSPLPSSTDTVLELEFATARSGFPSPFRSPIATETGLLPVAKSVFAPNLAVAVAEQHRHRVGAASSPPPGRACRRRSGPRSPPSGERSPSRSRSSPRSGPSPLPSSTDTVLAPSSPPPGRASRRRSSPRSPPSRDCVPVAKSVFAPKVPSPLPSSTDTVLESVVRHRQVGLAVPVQVPDRHGAGTAPGREVGLRPERARRRCRAAPTPCWSQ